MFRAVSLPVAAALIALAAPAAAQSPFDGTWKGDPATSRIDAKPDRILIKDGVYSCATCLPPLTVAADGAFHPIKDRPYWDELAVKILDDRTVRSQYKKDGRVVGETRRQVSEDGQQLIVSSINTNNAAELPINASSTSTRVGTVPAGAHAVSGEWTAMPANTISDAAVTVSLKVTGDRLHLTTPTGETLDATFGGPYAINEGNPGKMTTKAERPTDNAIRLTDMLMGKIVQVSTYTLGADNATMTGEWEDPRDGSKGSFVLKRQ